MLIYIKASKRGETMTRVLKKTVKCIKCGQESQQLTVYSVNFSLGKKEDNEKLMRHQQVCPHCNYTAPLINVQPKRINAK